MENKDQPANPLCDNNGSVYKGLTKYEQVAKDFCAALISEVNQCGSDEKLIIYGFDLADEFFKQLKERQK